MKSFSIKMRYSGENLNIAAIIPARGASKVSSFVNRTDLIVYEGWST